eukprot:g8996.t1
MSFPQFVNEPVSMGTTVIAARYNEGVILAADSRTSLGTYVHNRAADKIDMLTENIFLARSGVAAHSQAVRDNMIVNLEYHALQLKDEVSVKTAAKMIENILYKNKDVLETGIIVAGFDKQEGGSVYSVTMGGTLVKASFALGGSGSIYIHGFFDKYWKGNMTETECKEFLIQAVAHAMARDGASGGCIRLVCVNKDGAKKAFIPGNQVHPYILEPVLTVYN